jgi:nitrite reductase/ring-hydroxylating ferredoxin subunit
MIPVVRMADSAGTGSATAAVDDVADEVALGPVADLARRKRYVVTVGGLELLVIFHRKRFTVVTTRCPHRGARLDNARIRWRTLTCPQHAYRYSLIDGKSVATPGCAAGRGGRLTMIPTRVVDGFLYASLDRAALAG